MKRSRQNLNYNPKLTWTQVNEIRRDYRWHSDTAGGAALARRYGVSANTINKIVRGKVWRVTPGDGNVPAPLVRPKHNWRAFAIAELQYMRNLQKLAGLLSALQNHPDDELLEEWLMRDTEPTTTDILSDEIADRHSDNTLFCNDVSYESAVLAT